MVEESTSGGESGVRRDAGRWLRAYLAATTFVCGGVIMTVELVAARAIAPLFGSSIYVWTSVIGVTLLALAIGYLAGGQLIDRWPNQSLLCGVLLLAGASLLVPVYARHAVLVPASRFGLRFGSLLACTVLFGPPLLVLGTVAPIAVRLYSRSLEHLGKEVGLLYSVSTVGSFVGTLLTGFFLIPSLGLSRLLACAAAVLAVMALARLLVLRSWGGMAAWVVLAGAAHAAIAAGTGGLHLPDQGWRVITSRDGLYGRLTVCTLRGAEKFLLIDGANQGSIIAHTGQAVSPYAYSLQSLAESACPEARTALVVGLGTGMIPTNLSKRGIETEVVEIDPLVARLFRQEFNLQGAAFPIHVGDGRAFLHRSRRLFDLIVLDAFAGDSVPSHLLTVEAFADVAARLNPGGAVIVNFVCLMGRGQGTAAASVCRTMRQQFAGIRAFCRQQPDGEPDVANVLIVGLPQEREFDAAVPEDLDVPASADWYVSRTMATEASFDGMEAQLLTDEHNPVDVLVAKSAGVWRRNILDWMGPELLLK